MKSKAYFLLAVFLFASAFAGDRYQNNNDNDGDNDDSGNYGGKGGDDDGSSNPACTVYPHFNCVVKRSDGGVTAYFGYSATCAATNHSKRSDDWTVPRGTSNYCQPGEEQRGQASFFTPGCWDYAFSLSLNKYEVALIKSFGTLLWWVVEGNRDHVYIDIVCPTPGPFNITPCNTPTPTPSPVTSAVPTSAPPTSAPPTSAPPTSAPPTSAPPTSAPPTSAPPTSAPPTSAPPTSAPPTSAPPTSAPPTSAPPTSAPPTSAPPTSAPPTSATPTSAPPTSAPPTSAPLTSAPPTSAPPTSATPTSAPPTSAPPTSAPPTSATPTSAPPTSAPPTSAPPTSATPTSAPPTSAPPTSAPPTSAPPTSAPPTSAPPTSATPTSAPPTSAPPPSSAAPPPPPPPPSACSQPVCADSYVAACKNLTRYSYLVNGQPFVWHLGDQYQHSKTFTTAGGGVTQSTFVSHSFDRATFYVVDANNGCTCTKATTIGISIYIGQTQGNCAVINVTRLNNNEASDGRIRTAIANTINSPPVSQYVAHCPITQTVQLFLQTWNDTNNRLVAQLAFAVFDDTFTNNQAGFNAFQSADFSLITQALNESKAFGANCQVLSYQVKMFYVSGSGVAIEEPQTITISALPLTAEHEYLPTSPMLTLGGVLLLAAVFGSLAGIVIYKKRHATHMPLPSEPEEGWKAAVVPGSKRGRTNM